MDIVDRLIPHFPTFGDWDHYYYPHYYYTTTNTNGTTTNTNGGVDDGLHQQDLYGVKPTDLYGGDEDYDQDLKKPTAVVLPTTTTVIVSPRKINNDTGSYELYYEEEEEKKREQAWVYQSPTKYHSSHCQATHDQYHRAVDEDLYKIPSHHIRSKFKVKILGFISSCFKPSTCVL